MFDTYRLSGKNARYLLDSETLQNDFWERRYSKYCKFASTISASLPAPLNKKKADKPHGCLPFSAEAK